MAGSNEELRARLLAAADAKWAHEEAKLGPDEVLHKIGIVDLLREAAATLARQEAGPNDDDAEGFDAVLRHGFFIQEVDFGDEGKGYFVRMRDFNTIAARLDECLARQEEGREAVDREAVLRDYVEDYEFLGETEDGRDACYQPNERERLLIEDAIRGWEALELPATHPAPPSAGEGDALRALIAAVRDLDLYNGSTDSVRLKDRLDELCDAAEQALATPAPQAAGVSEDRNLEARELFASHLEAHGYHHGATAIREGRSAEYDRAAIDAIAAALTAAGAAPEGLFALHLMGPDDVYAAPSYETALRVANTINCEFADSSVKPYAVVVPWLGGPEKHSAGLADWERTFNLPYARPATPNPGAQHGQEGRE